MGKTGTAAFTLSTVRNMTCCVRLLGTYSALVQIGRRGEDWKEEKDI